MKDIKTIVRESKAKETTDLLDTLLNTLASEGLTVEFGKIGVRTTYALIHNEDNSIETVGYTFLRDMKYFNETVGKLKALQQAIARREVTENSNP